MCCAEVVLGTGIGKLNLSLLPLGRLIACHNLGGIEYKELTGFVSQNKYTKWVYSGWIRLTDWISLEFSEVL
jgi:hypothetical protein